MPGIVRIELAGSPQGKGRPRFSRKTGCAYTPAATRRYEDVLRYTAQETMAGRPPLDGPLDLTVEAYMPIPRSWSRRRQSMAAHGLIRPTTRPDFDNLLKACDALNKVVWNDDAQVVRVRCEKAYSVRPRLVVIVQRITVDPATAGKLLPEPELFAAEGAV